MFYKANNNTNNNHPQYSFNNNNNSSENLSNDVLMDKINLILTNNIEQCDDDNDDGIFCNLIKKKEKVYLSKSELNRVLSFIDHAIDSGLIDISSLSSMDLSSFTDDDCKKQNCERDVLNTRLCSSLIPKLSNLKNINLSNVLNVNDSFLMELSENIPNLERLYIKYTPVTDYGVCGLLHSLRNIQNLQELDLSNTNITNRSLEKLAEQFQMRTMNNFRKLDVERVKLDLKTASKILKLCSRLSKIGKGEEGAFYKFRDDIILKLPSIDCNESVLTLWHPLLNESVLKNILLTFKQNPNIQMIDLKSKILSIEAVLKLIKLLKFSSIQQIKLNDEDSFNI